MVGVHLAPVQFESGMTQGEPDFKNRARLSGFALFLRSHLSCSGGLRSVSPDESFGKFAKFANNGGNNERTSIHSSLGDNPRAFDACVVWCRLRSRCAMTRLVSNAMIFYERGNPWVSPRDQEDMRRKEERLFYDGTEIEVQSPRTPKPRKSLPPQRVKHRPDAPDFSRKALAILRGK